LGLQWKNEPERNDNNINSKGDAIMVDFKDIEEQLNEQNEEKYKKYQKEQEEKAAQLKEQNAKKEEARRVKEERENEERIIREERENKEKNYDSFWNESLEELENINDPSGFAAYAVEEGLIDSETEEIRKASWGEILSEQKGVPLTYEYLKQGNLEKNSPIEEHTGKSGKEICRISGGLMDRAKNELKSFPINIWGFLKTLWRGPVADRGPAMGYGTRNARIAETAKPVGRIGALGRNIVGNIKRHSKQKELKNIFNTEIRNQHREARPDRSATIGNREFDIYNLEQKDQRDPNGENTYILCMTNKEETNPSKARSYMKLEGSIENIGNESFGKFVEILPKLHEELKNGGYKIGNVKDVGGKLISSNDKINKVLEKAQEKNKAPVKSSGPDR